MTALAYSANEGYLVSAGADHVILIWDLMVNRVSIQISPLADEVGALLEIILCIDVTRQVTRTLRGHVDVINSISISPDCTTLVSASYDWTVRYVPAVDNR